MLTQKLPASAADYSRRQRREIQAAMAAIDLEWSRMTPEFDQSWDRIAANVSAIMLMAQERIVRQSRQYTPAVLEETRQVENLRQVASPAPEGLIGLTGAGMPIDYTTSWAPVQAKKAVAGGADPYAALTTAGNWLSLTALTALSDTGRATEALGMYSHGVKQYVRMLVPPSCSRCVILAGARYRSKEAFDRHPECDCRHIPANEAVAGDLTVDPQAYFNSLDEAGQVKFAGSIANRQAILDGADINQIVNAYRRSGLSPAQSPLYTRYGLKFTTQGISDRSWAGQQQVGLGVRSARRSATPRARLMPESIYANAANAEDALQMLRANGWILDPNARRAGRAALDREVIKRRSARRATKRAIAREERLAAVARASADQPDIEALREAARAMRARRGTGSRNTPPGTQTGSGGAGRTPPAMPRSGGAADDNPRAYWMARQADAERRLGISFQGDMVEPHELAFVESFVGSGQSLRWIAKDSQHHTSRNDFLWLDAGLEIELKSSKAKYTTIRNAVHKAVKRARTNHGIVKDHFIIDLAGQPLTRELAAEIANYNRDRSAYAIRRLWVWSQGRLTEITLRT